MGGVLGTSGVPVDSSCVELLTQFINLVAGTGVGVGVDGRKRLAGGVQAQDGVCQTVQADACDVFRVRASLSERSVDDSLDPLDQVRWLLFGGRRRGWCGGRERTVPRCPRPTQPGRRTGLP